MNRLIILLLLFFISYSAHAQITVSGKVIDKEYNEPLSGASVIIKDDNGKIKKFTTTKGDGSFSLQLTASPGFTLEVTMIGFTVKSLSLNNLDSPVIIKLEPGQTLLKEVTVKADPIREQGDTISYLVNSFAQNQDRSIGDVLKRMPGINVGTTGKIQYQGEDINKFYIEGSDLLGGKYGIATNGISHEDVGAVEVLENHQPMQVLTGISFSDKAAINLKLKNKAKAAWTFHGDAGVGYSGQPEGILWDGELFAMAVMPGFQNITTVRTNNFGEDISASATDFFASRRESGLSRYVSVMLPDVPNLSMKRTLFNRSALISANTLWKMKNAEFKSQIDYSFNRVTAKATDITTYFLESGNRIIAEDRNGRSRTHSLSGKFIYEVNQKATFINNTLSANFNWNDLKLRMTGSLPNEQSTQLPDCYVADKFKMIKRLNGKHLVTFQSNTEWESLPQTLNVSMYGNPLGQHIGEHAFYTNQSAAYAFLIKGITISVEGGIKGYLRSLNSELHGLDNSTGGIALQVENISGETENVLNTNYFTTYATPRFEYWVKRVNFTLNAPVSLANYTFDKALANRSEVYFSPSLGMNWKPNNRFSMTVRGSTGRSPMNLNMIQSGFIMTDYRTFKKGVDDFYNTASQRISGNFTYKHTRKGVFANIMAMQSWSHLPYTMMQQLYGDYIVYSYSDAKSDAQNFMAMGKVGKTLDFMRGSVNVSASFNRAETHLMSENNSVNSVSVGWNVSAKINGAPLNWLTFDYVIDFSNRQLKMNGIKNSWIGAIENSLLINIMPGSKWEWRLMGDLYCNELTAGNYKNVLLLDSKLVFKLSKRIDISATLNNIYNQKTYNYITYSQLSSYESQRWLRGRELMLSISLRK